MLKFPAFLFLGVALHLASTAEVAADERDDIRLYMQGRYVFQRQCAVWMTWKPYLKPIWFVMLWAWTRYP